MTWTSDSPISLSRLQAAIGRLAPKLARAKGFFETLEDPGRRLLPQFAGGRATLAPAGPSSPELARVRIVLIAEIGTLSATEIGMAMEGWVPA